MRITHLSKLIYEKAKKFKLQNCEVVIDGQNFFYKTYKDSGLQSRFGCESDKYAQYLRSYLSMFKEANVKCYFFFQSGHGDPVNILNKYKEQKNKPFEIGKTPFNNFVKEVYKEVLEEMNFDYVICQSDSKRECIAFAQKHKCPIISHDIEFCFSGVPYIPVNIRTKKLDKLFKLDDFMRTFGLDEEKLAFFIVLTDEFKFPENHFQDFMKAMNIPLYSQYDRNLAMIHWLSSVDSTTALNHIFKYVTPKDQATFLEINKEVKAFIRRQEKPGLPSEYLENQNNFQIEKKDTRWFEKGVVIKAVAIPYVSLYRWGTLHTIAPRALLLSLDIIEYAFGLLCNFGKSEFKYFHETDTGIIDEVSVEMSNNFRKPDYTGIESPFENGWSEVDSLGLFEHFLTETLQIFDFTTLETLPEDARLLFIALVYFSRKKPESTIHEVCSVLLSYLVLNVLSEVECEDEIHIGLASRPILDATTNKNSIEHQDKLVARQLLAEYLVELSEDNAKTLSFRLGHQRRHSLNEFQYCLQHLNFLNRLCGRPYQPTAYNKTFNGTLVSKIMYYLKDQKAGPLELFENKLNQAPTVLAFWNGLIEVYEALN